MYRSLLTLLAVIITTSVFAQVEICNNGFDDDFDGFIDCYDGDCASNAACDGVFLGNDGCTNPPPSFPAFTLALDFASPNETTNHLSRMAIGDLDRDGIPEIITMNRYTKKVFILNGNDGSIKHEATVDFEPYWEVAIGNINNDACGEIFFMGYLDLAGSSNDGIYILAYDCQLNFLWRTAQKLRGDPINFGLADFDGDGLVELYAKDEVYDAHTGVRIIQSTAPTYNRINGGPVAANIVGDSKLELIIGLSIYQVNLGGRTAGAGSLTLLQNRNEYFIRNEYNATSIADYNLDGFLDVIASGSTIAHDKNTTVFFWDVKNNTLQTYRDNTGSYAPNGWNGGTGRINIADLDGDGQLNMSFVSGKYLYALNENMQMLWRVVINEETSGYTGCTLFDFNGDGKAEIVYRDERYLYIIDGTDGSIFNQQNCISRTNREYPIVADVDADGSTELCVTCGFDDVAAAANFNTLSYSRYSHVRVFKSGSEPWVPARRVWNQHGYFVVNVNDDLTIPKTLQAHHLVFSTGSCTQGPNRPLNKFLNQSPFLNSDGCPTYSYPDLAFATTPAVTPPTCPDLNFTVSFDITNLGDATLTGNVPITFYTTNPTKPGSTKLNTIFVAVNNLTPNSILSITDAVVTGNGSDSLYVVLNDAGTTVPTPISLPNTNFLECFYDNIMGVPVNPLPVAITALEVNPNVVCAPVNNGSANAFVLLSGVQNTTDFDFYWSDGPVAKPIASADFVGAVYSGIPGGTYSVYARHKTANCNSDTVQVVINSLNDIPDIVVSVVSNQTSCNPFNGSLEANLVGGNAGYTFAWEDFSGPIGVSGPILSGRQAGLYTVVVTETSTGCQNSADAVINLDVQISDVQATASPILNCIDPNSGSVNAQALLSGVVQPNANFTFDWYFYDNITSTRGSQLPIAHGAAGTPNRTGLPAGFYEVEVSEISTGCQANTTAIVEIITQTPTIDVLFTELAPQTSCDPANPNGKLQADAVIGGVTQNPTAYSFEWFVGQNTLPANSHASVSGTNNQIAESLLGGGQAYTVKITDILTNCSVINHTTISQNVLVPVVTLSKTDNGICNPLLASGNFTGSVSATITFDGNPVVDFTGYTFEWYKGTLVSGLPLANTTSLVSLDSGYYTLVVTKNDVACASNPQTIRVNNTAVLPIVATAANPSTNCLPLAPGVTPNGSAQVTLIDGVAPNPATHSFQWFDGITTMTAVGGATNSTLTDLQGGGGVFYTVQVTNTANGCQNTSTIEIPNTSTKPIITLTPVDNSICDPLIAGSVGNGSVQVQSITYNGAPFVGAVAYQWFTGVGTGSPIAGQTNSILANLGAGNYSSTVTIPSLGCVSDFVAAQVSDNVILPTILATPSPSTNCAGGTPNGSIAASVDVSGIPTTTGFSFQWHTGIALTDPQVPTLPNNGNTPNVIQLQGGQNFTVGVTNLSTGCKNTRTVLLQDNSQIPVISPLTFSPNINCTAPFNGAASVNAATPFTYRGSTITNPYAGFTLTWSGGTVNPAGDQISALPPGIYTLQVTAGAGNTITNNNDNCISNPVQVTILNSLTYPAIAIAKNDQTSCDPTAPNGQLTATVGGGTAGHTFRWFRGTGTLAPSVEITDAGTPNIIRNLISTDYTALVTNQTTRCESTTTQFLPNNIVNPTLAFSNINNVTTCVPPNGSATAILTNVTPAPNADFTVFYVRTFSDAVNPVSPPTDPVVIKTSTETYSSTSTVVNGTNPPALTGLMPGYITAMVVDNFTSCESNPATVQILDLTTANQINVNAVVAAGFCGGNGGQIDITAVGGAGGYTYEWYSGTPSNNDINFFNNPPNMGSAVFVTNNEDLGVVTPAGGATSGTYTLVVRDVAGCGAYLIDNVPYAGAPVITVTPTDPERCTAPFDGAINIAVAGAFGPYSITFFQGNTTSTVIRGEICDDGIDNDGDGLTDGADPDCGAINLTAAGLTSGEYLVRVIDYLPANRPCPLDESVVLVQKAFAPLVTLDNITSNTSCDPLGSADGAVSITINKDVLDTRNPITTPIQYQVTTVSPAPVTPPAFPALISSGVNSVSTTLNYGFAPQAYTITVREATSGCTTDQVVNIPDQPVVPTLQPANVAIIHDSFCAPLSNGSAAVTAITPISISDYEYSWYADAGLTTLLYQANGTGAGGGELFNATKPGYALGGIGQGIGTQTYYVRGERLPGTGPGAGCPTPALQVVIQDEHVTPTVTLSTVPNTSCDPLFGEGSISVATITNSPSPAVQNALYSYTMSPDPNTVGTLMNQNGALSTPFIRLTENGGAPYTVTALNQISGCAANATATILPGVFDLSIINTVVNDKLICLTDGDITATQITIDRSIAAQPALIFNTPLTTDFEFRWFKSVPGTFSSGSPLTDGTPAIINGQSLVMGSGIGEYNDPAPTLGAGTYYVVARQLTGPGKFGANCETVPLRIEVLDKSENPLATLTPTTDTSCSGPFEGSIVVNVSDNSAIAGPFDYNYTWAALTAGRVAPVTINPYSGVNNNFTQIEDGVYELSVLNNQTGCVSIAAQTTIDKTLVPIIVASANPQPQLICNPDGSITVIDISVGGVVDPNHNNFNFLWYKDVVTPGTEIAPINPPGNDVLDITDFPTIEAGTYFVKATRILGVPRGSGCESAPLRVDINKNSVDPDANFSLVTPTSSCDPTSPNGAITAVAIERDLTTDTYTFSWTLNGGAVTLPIVQVDASPSSQLTVAPEGNYVVGITNTLTGCTFSKGLTLIEDQSLSLPSIVQVIPTNPVDCFPTGSAAVTQITIGGSTTLTAPPDDLDTDFDYEWYKGSDAPASLLAGEQNRTLLNQKPDSYFVRVTDTRTLCVSSFIEVAIDSANIIYPDVKIRQTSPQVICDVALGGSGALIATVDVGKPRNSRNSYPDYDLFWYPSLDTLGAQINAFSDSTITNLLSGNYSVKVFDRITNCRAKGIFVLPNDTLAFKPNVVLTSSPLTLCNAIDGFIQAKAVHFTNLSTDPLTKKYPISLLPYNYEADFYTGTPSDLDNPGPDLPNIPGVVISNSTNFIQPNLPPTQAKTLYTVRIRDLNTGCFSVDTVSVEDKRVFPIPAIAPLAPITNCDPTKPNGVARVAVNGAINGFIFNWYEGNVVAGLPVYTGVEYNLLKPQPLQYTIEATNIFSGCTGTTVTSFEFSPLSIPSPTIEILSHITSCISDNGALSVSVSGNTRDYIFDWYNGTVEAPPADFVGEIYVDLPTGTYSVTATSKITGCKSPLVLETLEFKPVYPEIDFTTQSATCNLTNGLATLIVQSSVPLETIEWFDSQGNVIEVGPNLMEVGTGVYSVVVTTQLGCKTAKEIPIDTEIRPFNGISRGSSVGQNDYFHIDCIENFEKNIVRIYNRAGTLVYEGERYDNSSTVFDGKSNKGISPMGNNLPDGTYFYIIDKRDGSKPLIGYLEIVN